VGVTVTTGAAVGAAVGATVGAAVGATVAVGAVTTEDAASAEVVGVCEVQAAKTRAQPRINTIFMYSVRQ